MSLVSRTRKRPGKRWKKIVLRSLLVFFLLLVVLFTVVPWILYSRQKEITQHVIGELNKTFAGKLLVEDSHISLFQQFPYVSIDLTNVRFYATKDTTQKPIYKAGDFYVGFDIQKLLQGKYDVRRLRMEKGHIDLVQYPNGDLNLLLATRINHTSPSSGNVTDTSALRFRLKRIRLKAMNVTYFKTADSLLVQSYIAEARATFSINDEHIKSRLNANMVCNIIHQGDTGFFRKKKVALQTNVEYDGKKQLVQIAKGELSLDNGEFGFSGSIDIDDQLFTDLELHGSKPDFNTFLSLAPPDVAENFKPFANAGKVFFDARLKGRLAPGHKYHLDARFGCENGYFLNTQSNKKLDNLGFKGYFHNGADSSWKTAELQINDITARPGTGVFAGNVMVRNFKDPHITVQLHSDLDLQFLGAFLNIKNLQGIRGKVLLDMNFNELIDFEQPESNLVRLKEGIDSKLSIRDLHIKLPGYTTPVENLNLEASMKEGRLTLDTLRFRLGQSDLALNGSLTNLPAIFHAQEKEIAVTLTAQSNRIKLSDFLAFDTALAKKNTEEISNFSVKLAFNTSVKQLTHPSGIPRGNFYIEDLHAKLNHYPHTFHNFRADLLINDDTMRLRNFSGKIDETDFRFWGRLSNYELWKQPNKKGNTEFAFYVSSNLLKLQDLFSYNGENYVPEDYRQEEIRELKLSASLSLNYDSVLKSADLTFKKMEGKMKVHPLKLENFKGTLSYSKKQLHLRDFAGKMGKSDLQGTISLYLGADEAMKKQVNKIQIRSSFLDVDELLNYNAEKDSVAHDSAFNIFELPFTHLALEADIQKMNYHRIWLRRFSTRLRMEPNHFLYVDTMDFRAARGRLAIKGYFNGSDSEHIYFQSNIRLDSVQIDQLLLRFDNFGQDYTLNKNLKGVLSGTINSKVYMHPNLVPILDKAEAEMDIVITQGALVDFAPMQALSGYFKDKNLRLVRFDTLSNTLTLKNGMLNIPAMNINSSLGFIEISGTQSLNLNMDYYVRVPLKMVTQIGFRYLFGGRKREEVDPEQEDAIVYRDKDKKIAFVNLRIAGTPDDYKISLKKKKS